MSPDSPLQFGFCVPPFAMPGARFFRTPAWTDLDPRAAVDAAVAAERLGFDSIWMADHLMHGHDGAILEGWTALSVIAGCTERVKLGTIHMAQAFRPPSIAAKMAATLDALSGGRLIFFYDWGGEAESLAYGLPYPPEAERAERLEEGIELVKALWTADEPLDFSGAYYSTSGAICRPKPAQRPRPPVWIGEARSDSWLDMVSRQADGFNSAPASPDRLAEKFEQLQIACRRNGRDPSSLERSLEIQILIAPTEGEVKERARQIAAIPARQQVWSSRPAQVARQLAGTPGILQRRQAQVGQQAQTEALLAYLADDGDTRPLSALTPNWLAGSPESITAQLQVYVDLGVSHFMLWFLDFPSLDGMSLFAEQVAPRFQAR